jgi:aspartate-semialdehyde dehydrogenase
MGSQKILNFALVGTESLQGRELRRRLDSADLPLHKMSLYNPGVEEEYSHLTQYRGEAKAVQAPDPVSLAAADLVFLAAGREESFEYGNLAADNGIPVIDLSQAFNRDPRTSLIVAGVNDSVLTREKPVLIATPHPAAVMLSHLFHELRSFQIQKAVSFVLQPVSAYGQEGIDELAAQTLELLEGSGLSKKVFKAQIAFNCLSQTESVDKDGFSEDEKQIVEEVRRIFNRDNFPLTLSIIQGPVFFSYSIMTYLELGRKTSVSVLKNAFKESRFVKAHPPSRNCPASAVRSADSDKVIVSQIKNDRTVDSGYWIWCTADNLTRGSVLNALEVSRTVMEMIPR